MLRFGTDYVDRGWDYYERRYQSRVVSHLMRRAQAPDYTPTKYDKYDTLPATSSPASA